MDVVRKRRRRLSPKKVKESNDAVAYINLLPEEIIVKIFSYLKKNELCRIARVCKQWNECTKYPLLWKKVDILFKTHYRQKYKASKSIIEKLPSCVTHIKFDFRNAYSWHEPFKFDEFSEILQKRCPKLQTLVLRHAQLTYTLPLIIDLCTQFLPNVQVLALHCSLFADYSVRREFDGVSNIKVLDLSGCFLRHINKPPFSKMPFLKELYLARTNILERCWFKGDASFLEQIEVLDLACTETDTRTYLTIQNHALSLKELNVSRTHLEDHDIKNSEFPYLETISLRYCRSVTCDGIISLIMSIFESYLCS